jgi:hypothetical protein
MSVLNKLYEDISGRMGQRLSVEDVDVTAGAVPLLAMRLYSNLGSYEPIAITGRLSGSYTIPRKREVEVQVAKVKIGNGLRGIEMVRQFEDCRGCAKIPGCDQFEAGSILFPEKMFTGYTYQDVSYDRSIRSPFGNCEFRFQGHHPSEDLYKVANRLHHHLTPRTLMLLESCRHFASLDTLERHTYQINIMNQEVERINFAIDCASVIQESLSH